MKHMLDDLLDLARINEGKITLQRTRVDLGTEVQQALEVAHRLFALRKQVVSLSQPVERMYVMADPVRLGQCFANLFANAAKYTNRGGRIEVSLVRDDEDAVVHVHDNGIGIPADLLPNVFDLFRQAPRGSDRAGGGLGLGLTIVRRLIELHEGRVEATSEGVGMGSEFVVRLPVLDGVQDASPPQRPRPTTAGLKVLLVEDSSDAAEMMAGALEMLGRHVVIAHDGPAALAAVATDCPDVGLLDLGLPGMSGYELAAKLRAGGFCPPSLKLVAVSGYSKDAEALAAAGFDSHLTKPVDFEQLGEMLANVIAAGREPPCPSHDVVPKQPPANREVHGPRQGRRHRRGRKKMIFERPKTIETPAQSPSAAGYVEQDRQLGWTFDFTCGDVNTAVAALLGVHVVQLQDTPPDLAR